MRRQSRDKSFYLVVGGNQSGGFAEYTVPAMIELCLTGGVVFRFSGRTRSAN